MPSPIGHALGGIAAGWSLAPRRDLAIIAILAGVAIVPDLDLLVGDHRGVSHSLGMAAAAGVLTIAATRQPRWGAAVALAWASHVLLDWMSNDTWPPLGVMAFWPLSRDYYKASVEVFPAVSRKYWLAEFWVYNLKALVVELLVIGPIAALVLCRRPRGSDPALTRV